MLSGNGKNILRILLNKEMSKNNHFLNTSGEKSIFKVIQSKKTRNNPPINDQDFKNEIKMIDTSTTNSGENENIKQLPDRDSKDVVPFFWKRFFKNDFFPDENDMKLNYDMTLKLNPSKMEIFYSFEFNTDKSFDDLMNVMMNYISIFWYYKNEVLRYKIGKKINEHIEKKLNKFEKTLDCLSLSVFLKTTNLQNFIPYVFNLAHVSNNKK